MYSTGCETVLDDDTVITGITLEYLGYTTLMGVPTEV